MGRVDDIYREIPYICFVGIPLIIVISPLLYVNIDSLKTHIESTSIVAITYNNIFTLNKKKGIIMTNHRTKVSFLTIAMLVIVGNLLIDPDIGIISNLPFGINMVIFIKGGIMGMFVIVVVHQLRTLLFDKGDEDITDYVLVDTAIAHPIGAGLVYIGRSIRLVMYSAIIMGAIIYL